MASFAIQGGKSANNTSAVSVTVPQNHSRHTVYVEITGTPTAGTFAIACDGQTISGSITATALAPVFWEGHVRTITVTPSNLTAGCTFAVRHVSTI